MNIGRELGKMDKLQSILGVSQIIVVGADASREEKISRAFFGHQERIQFISASANKDLKKSQTLNNSFFILSISNSSELLERLTQLQLHPQDAMILCSPTLREEIGREIEGRLFFLNPDDIALSFLHFWEQQLTSLLQTELLMTKIDSVLALVESTLELPHENTEARARLTYALATQLSVDLDQIKRNVRLSIYYPLIALEGWQKLARENFAIEEILPLLEQKLLLGRISMASTCPQDLSLELVLVECAIFAQKNIGKQEKIFRSELKLFSSQLPFKVRTQIRNAAERSFKYLWRANEAA